MLHSGRFTAILDACVLYPAPLRDILLRLAEEQLYRPKWSDLIHNEWKDNLLKNREDLHASQIDRTIYLMNRSFPDAEVNGFSSLIQGLSLPDENDRHVLAAAIRSRADVIVTFNLKDFPIEVLNNFDIEPVHPDQFIINLVDLDEIRALNAFKSQVGALKNPPKTNDEMIETLRSNSLNKTAVRFKKLLVKNLS